MSIHPPSRNETAAGVLGPAQAAAVANLTLPTVVGAAQLTGGAYTVTAAYARLQVTATSTVPAQINLPAGSAGATITVTNSGGAADTANTVTVVPAGADTILGNTTLAINGRETYQLAYNTVTTDWEVL